MSEDWIEWHGGDCPLPFDAAFEYKLRCGSGGQPLTTPQSWNWKHDGGEDDIVAYRIVEAQ